MTYSYQSLSKEEKIKIFQKCQSFLVKNYPKSEFIARKSILSGIRSSSVQILIKLFKDFNGEVYWKDDAILFFKTFIAKDLEEVQKKIHSLSEKDGDTIFIIFATYKSNSLDIKELARSELSGIIKNISFSRSGRFKFYGLDRFLKKT